MCIIHRGNKHKLLQNTHTHAYIYIYTEREREGERERDIIIYNKLNHDRPSMSLHGQKMLN